MNAYERNEINRLLNSMSDEEVREQLVTLRERQQKQMEVEKPFVCDGCKLTIPPGNIVYEVAVSGQIMPEDPTDLDFDPQFDEYLCSECITKVVGLSGWPGKK